MEEKDEVFDSVRDILVDHLGVAKEKVTQDASIIEDLGADSLDVVDIVQSLEERFDSKIEDSEVEKLKTVEDVVDCIFEKVKNKA